MKTSVKNKFFIVLFIVIILLIIGILVYSVRLSSAKTKKTYSITNSMTIFNEDTSIIDTSVGGKIEEKWNGDYYYTSFDEKSYKIGLHPIIYDTSIDNVALLGTKYQVMTDGKIAKSDDYLTISDNSTYFYKLDDRVYLIVAPEIYTEQKDIYSTKYLIVYIDVQGNASLLNDYMNLKTINPIKLLFGNYIFDVANEKLKINELEVDLKSIIGSTNQYVEKKIEEKEFVYNEKELLDSYNQLVKDFSQYAKNHNINTSGNNQVTYNNYVINNGSGTGVSANNNTSIDKRVSLRGAISYQSYVDITYIVTDPENKYQAVYLLVTGFVNDHEVTEKIILDKYDTKCRINDLTPNSEYTISLGYIEVVKENDEKKLIDNIEDVINIRTSKIKYQLEIEKISLGKVYFNYKMPSNYAFESCEIALYIDGRQENTMQVNYNSMISSNGFSGSMDIDNGFIYELRIINAVHNSKTQDINISKKFVLST